MQILYEIQNHFVFQNITHVCTHRYIGLVSGLNIGSSHCDQLSLQLFIDYITGSVGGASGHCSNIVRLIIAGNSITNNPVKSSIANDDKKVKNVTFLLEGPSWALLTVLYVCISMWYAEVPGKMWTVKVEVTTAPVICTIQKLS